MGEALRRLDRAREIYQEIEDWPAAGRAMLAIARVIGVADPQEALRRTDDALGLLDPADDPRADLRGFLQLGWYLVDTGRPQDAQVLLAIPQADPEGRWGGEPERLLRLWLAARAARALGRPEEAAPALAAVVAGWRSLGRLRPRALRRWSRSRPCRPPARPRLRRRRPGPSPAPWLSKASTIRDWRSWSSWRPPSPEAKPATTSARPWPTTCSAPGTGRCPFRSWRSPVPPAAV